MVSVIKLSRLKLGRQIQLSDLNSWDGEVLVGEEWMKEWSR
jgi:hypothetical protein